MLASRLWAQPLPYLLTINHLKINIMMPTENSFYFSNIKLSLELTLYVGVNCNGNAWALRYIIFMFSMFTVFTNQSFSNALWGWREGPINYNNLPSFNHLTSAGMLRPGKLPSIKHNAMAKGYCQKWWSLRWGTSLSQFRKVLPDWTYVVAWSSQVVEANLGLGPVVLMRISCVLVSETVAWGR